MMHRNKSVDVHRFAMVPRADIPRASFSMQHAHKTTFNSGYLIPVFCEEVLPGDSFKCKMTAFARLATPIFPIMDNMYLDSFFFFVPNRLVWVNWRKFMGEQDNPGDSTSFVLPTISIAPASGGYAVNSLQDYFGLPTAGQVVIGGPNVNGFSHNVLPLRMYNLIWNQWFRDQNQQNAAVVNTGDSGDLVTDWTLLRRGKRHDYFTSCLPWPQKSGATVSIPLGTSALVKTSAAAGVTGTQSPSLWSVASGGGVPANSLATGFSGSGAFTVSSTGATTAAQPQLYPNNLYADLSTATAATINQLRLAFQTQKLLERDARGGTRYTEIIRAHFGVVSPDARLQRPEYLGGGSTPVIINPVAQTSATSITGGSSPQGNLAAVGTVLAHKHGFTQSFTEHGYVIGLVSVRADLTYQQGLRRHWSRSTRYDFYFPAFAMLGEQGVLNKEIYIDGSANDPAIFGYQERWAEYRYSPSMITGLFRSTSAGALDGWHLAQKFASVPTLGDTFIREFPPVSRVIAVPTAPEFIFDSFFDVQCARPMPLYSVPGMIDHF